MGARLPPALAIRHCSSTLNPFESMTLTNKGFQLLLVSENLVQWDHPYIGGSKTHHVSSKNKNYETVDWSTLFL